MKVISRCSQANEGAVTMRLTRNLLLASLAFSLALAPSDSLAAHKARHKKNRDGVQIAKLPFFKGKESSDTESSTSQPSENAAKKTESNTETAKKEPSTKAAAGKTSDKETVSEKSQAASDDSKVSKKDKRKKNEKSAAAAEEKPHPEEAKSATQSAPPVKAEAKETLGAKDASAEAGASAKEEAPVFVPDASLISVLKDVSKALKDEEQVKKLVEDATERTVIAAAQGILERALDNPELSFNRIISKEEERSVADAITPEAWSSGEMKVSDDYKGSLAAVWAKKVNGLLNLTIAGRCNSKSAPNGKKIGNFMVVIYGRSPIEAGFDIQSQANVNFWLGQLSSITVDSDCLSKEEPAAEKPDKASSASSDADVKKNSITVLPVVFTERFREYQTRLTAYQERQLVLAKKLEDERKAKEESAAQQAKAIAEAAAKALAEATARAISERKAPVREKSSESKDSEDSEESTPAKEAPKVASTGESADKAAAEKISERKASDAFVNSAPRDEKTPVKMASLTPRLDPPPTTGNQSGWESPAAPPQAKLPSASATIVLPDRAVAGQFLSASVIDQNKNGESSVELSFNGATLATDGQGRALYMVPEDATPGHTLHVALASRPELPPAQVELLQPLSVPSDRELPKIDKVTPMLSSKSTLVIDGHNFDGNALHDRILIDAFHEARVIAASPVQIKALLPQGIAPGQHSICVGNAGMRSNSSLCEVIATEIQQDPREAGKDNLSKLIIKVLGTTNRVPVKLTNNTPDVIKISKGNELRFTTPGGTNNAVIVSVQRLRKGAFNVEASIDN
ncbi:MAG TPA: IPT/TIG domain-containing protein [Candidatus Obscuribacterales bacterium]